MCVITVCILRGLDSFLDIKERILKLVFQFNCNQTLIILEP